MYNTLFPRIKASPYLSFNCPLTYSSVCSSAMFMYPSIQANTPVNRVLVALEYTENFKIYKAYEILIKLRKKHLIDVEKLTLQEKDLYFNNKDNNN